ncbi:hypothetical protein B0T18DRAFT_418965 [Schizothecium vesticola]|uniref:Uncharacterized protein n=1 Tax=Schizothecium vesticola TaxID=314040 RepID=A0AA40EK78_9PEZI|nr:hypothetical protein B0T18DRAFT_418965 [Schizothecium vesticola]
MYPGCWHRLHRTPAILPTIPSTASPACENSRLCHGFYFRAGSTGEAPSHGTLLADTGRDQRQESWPGTLSEAAIPQNRY